MSRASSKSEWARAVDQMPGFLSLDVLRHVDGKGYVVMTRWESREAYEAWLQSPAFLFARVQVSLYDGSWMEWRANSELPVKTGPDNESLDSA